MNMMIARFTALLAGLLLDALIGDPEWFPHPVRFIGKYISWMETQLRKHCANRLRAAAVLLTISTVCLTMMLTAFIVLFFYWLHPVAGWISDALIAWMALSCKCLAKEAIGVQNALKISVARGRKQVARIVGRDTQQLSEDEIVKATIETVAENTTDGVISPILYYLIGGSIFAMGFKAASTLDSMVGYLDEKYRDIGWASAKLDDILNYPSARICALLMCLSAFILRLDWKNAIRIVRRDYANHKSPNCAWSEAAAAGALHIQLGGTHMYFGKPIEKPTIGDNDRTATFQDINSTCNLLYITTILMTLLCGMVVFLLVHST